MQEHISPSPLSSEDDHGSVSMKEKIATFTYNSTRTLLRASLKEVVTVLDDLTHFRFSLRSFLWATLLTGAVVGMKVRSNMEEERAAILSEGRQLWSQLENSRIHGTPAFMEYAGELDEFITEHHLSLEDVGGSPAVHDELFQTALKEDPYSQIIYGETSVRYMRKQARLAFECAQEATERGEFAEAFSSLETMDWFLQWNLPDFQAPEGVPLQRLNIKKEEVAEMRRKYHREQAKIFEKRALTPEGNISDFEQWAEHCMMAESKNCDGTEWEYPAHFVFGSERYRRAYERAKTTPGFFERGQ